MGPIKRLPNHCCLSVSKISFQQPLIEAKEAKNKNDQNGPILKDYYKYHIWGLQRCKKYSKIASGRGCTGIKIHHLKYCGLNGFLTDFAK